MGKNILSIDDDEDILYTIQEIILHQGWTPCWQETSERPSTF